MTEEAPFYVDMLLWAVYVLLTATTGLAVWSLWHGLATHSRTTGKTAGRLSAWAAAGVTVLLLAATFATGSSEPLTIVGGSRFCDALWLRTADMFIRSSLILIVLCSVLVAIGRFRR